MRTVHGMDVGFDGVTRVTTFAVYDPPDGGAPIMTVVKTEEFRNGERPMGKDGWSEALKGMSNRSGDYHYSMDEIERANAAFSARFSSRPPVTHRIPGHEHIGDVTRLEIDQACARLERRGIKVDLGSAQTMSDLCRDILTARQEYKRRERRFENHHLGRFIPPEPDSIERMNYERQRLEEIAYVTSALPLEPPVYIPDPALEEDARKKAAELKVKLRRQKMEEQERGVSATFLATPARPRTPVYCQSQYDPDEP